MYLVMVEDKITRIESASKFHLVCRIRSDTGQKNHLTEAPDVIYPEHNVWARPYGKTYLNRAEIEKYFKLRFPSYKHIVDRGNSLRFASFCHHLELSGLGAKYFGNAAFSVFGSIRGGPADAAFRQIMQGKEGYGCHCTHARHVYKRGV